MSAMMTPRLTTQFSVSVPDRPGALAKVTAILAGEGVNIAGAMTGGLGGPGLRFVTDHPGGVRERLQDEGCAVDARAVCFIELPDRPGELEKVASVLTEEGVRILQVYGSSGLGGKCGDRTAKLV